MAEILRSLNSSQDNSGHATLQSLIIGSATFGMDYGVTNKRGEVPQEEIKAILDQCRKNGVREVDTAQAYGRAEEKLGLAGVGDFAVTTKINLGPKDGPDLVETKTIQSLKRLKIKQISNLLLHNDLRLDMKDGIKIAESMHGLIQKGLVARVGISSYNPKRAFELCKKFLLQVVQLPANVLDGRVFEEPYPRVFYDMNIEVQLRSIFLQGLLLKNATNTSKKISPRVLHHAKKFRHLCRSKGIQPKKAAFDFIRERGKQSKIIFGISRKSELNDLLKIAKSPSARIQFNTIPWHEDYDPRSWQQEVS